MSVPTTPTTTPLIITGSEIVAVSTGTPVDLSINGSEMQLDLVLLGHVKKKLYGTPCAESSVVKISSFDTGRFFAIPASRIHVVDSLPVLFEPWLRSSTNSES